MHYKYFNDSIFEYFKCKACTNSKRVPRQEPSFFIACKNYKHETFIVLQPFYSF